jgi:hypothetical protein
VKPGPYPIEFTARNMAVTLKRKRSGEEFPHPGWSRLQDHIARHEKAGGWSHINRRRLDEPIEVEGYECVEIADVELFHPLA